MICGRCGRYTAPNSTYCPNDGWVLLADLPGRDAPARARVEFELPAHSAGLFARRNHERQRDSLEKNYRAELESRLEKWEKELSDDPENAVITRRIGLLAMLEGQLERASALLERAHKLDPTDFEIQVNYAIALARRGKLQPAIDLLLKAREQHPKSPLVLFNLALVGLQARRAPLVHQAIDGLEREWKANTVIAQEFHDDGVTVRGLAFLLEQKPEAALRQFEAAASHNVVMDAPAKTAAPDSTNPADQIEFISSAPNETPGTTPEQTEAEAETTMSLGRATAQADALNNLALAEVGLGQFERAVARLRAALKLEPGHTQVLNNLGVLAYRQGDVEAARRYLEVARQIEEFVGRVDAVTWNHLGAVATMQGDLDKGLEYFQRAGGTEHGEFEVYYNLGRSWIEHGKSDVGVPYLRQAFAIEPNNPDVHTVLGAAYLFSGRAQLYAEALKHLKRAMQLDSHHRTAAINLILALIEIRNNDVARQMIGQALKTFPTSAEPQFLGALLILDKSPDPLQAENQWAAAAQRFESALNARPTMVASLYNSALCQFMIGFRDTSSKLLEAAVQRDPSLGPAYYLIGYGHAIAKREDEALKAWNMALKYEPGNPDLHANMGALLYRKKDFQGAIRAYANAHNLLPGDSQILASLGVSFAQAKMYQQAILTIEQSIQINPRSPIAYSNLGLAYYLSQHIERAVDSWRIVSQLDSAYAEKRADEQQRSFDDSIIQLRHINWRERIVRLAPVLPRPQTRLLPGTNAREYRLVVTEPELQPLVKARREVERASRELAWMNLKS